MPCPNLHAITLESSDEHEFDERIMINIDETLANQLTKSDTCAFTLLQVKRAISWLYYHLSVAVI